MNREMFVTLNDKLTDDEFISTAIELNQKLNKDDSTKNSLLMINSEEMGPYDRNSNPFEQYRNVAGVGPLYKNGSASHNNTVPKGEPDHDMNATERNLTTHGHYYLN